MEETCAILPHIWNDMECGVLSFCWQFFWMTAMVHSGGQKLATMESGNSFVHQVDLGIMLDCG